MTKQNEYATLTLCTNAIAAVSEVELVYRSKVKPSDRPYIHASRDAFLLLKETWAMDQIDLVEVFKVLYLNRASRVLAIYEVSQGGLTGTVADPRLIFATALKLSATAMILCHNHPSGNLRPSTADEVLTQKMKQAGAFLDIRLVDHLIISSEGFLSFANEGLI